MYFRLTKNRQIRIPSHPYRSEKSQKEYVPFMPKGESKIGKSQVHRRASWLAEMAEEADQNR